MFVPCLFLAIREIKYCRMRSPSGLTGLEEESQSARTGEQTQILTATMGDLSYKVAAAA